MDEVPVPPIYAIPEVSRVPSEVVALPMPSPPEIYRSLVEPAPLPMATSPAFRRRLEGEEVPVSDTAKIGLEGSWPASCSTENPPHGVVEANPKFPEVSKRARSDPLVQRVRAVEVARTEVVRTRPTSNQ